MNYVEPRRRLTKGDTRDLIAGRESIMRLRQCMRVSLPTSRIRLPTRSLENATEIHDEDEDPCERGEEPESVVPFGGLWGGNVSVRRQALFLGFAHCRGGGGSG